jgi:hypothetical protein
MSDGEALFPNQPLPEPWAFQHLHDERAQSVRPFFINTATSERTQNDPRLPPLTDEWEILPPRPKTIDDPENLVEFRNKEIGKISKCDPRLTSAALQQRGAHVRNFVLV